MEDNLEVYMNNVKYYTNCYNAKTINHAEFMYYLQASLNNYYREITHDTIYGV